jgi:hypothetical protein
MTSDAATRIASSIAFFRAGESPTISEKLNPARTLSTRAFYFTA